MMDRQTQTQEGFSAASNRYAAAVNVCFGGAALAVSAKDVPKKTKKNVLKVSRGARGNLGHWELCQQHWPRLGEALRVVRGRKECAWRWGMGALVGSEHVEDELRRFLKMQAAAEGCSMA